MGVIVAKTKTKWGKFRPWLMIGTVTNAIVLFMMFAAPPKLDGQGLVAYAAVTYILWGVTYTMMDIPYWSMIPAFTESGKEREGLTTLARSCAGVGSAIIMVITMMAVHAIGGNNEIVGFKWFTLVVAVIFILTITLTCINIQEKSTVDVDSPSLGQMFRALVQNDQAMAVVLTIVLVNCAVYITSNLVIYFFKYDFGGYSWFGSYTLFNTFGGGIQILSMMLIFPILRKFLDTIKIFYVAIGSAVMGYAVLLVLAFTNMGNVFLLFVPGFFIFAASGVLQVLTTIFLANTVEYGELKNSRRDESVIFSMQTFVVKLASGIAAFVASIALQIFNLSSEATTEADKLIDFSIGVSSGAKAGLRMTMTVIPVIGLVLGLLWFKSRYSLNEARMAEINGRLKEKREETHTEETAQEEI
jgi:melibiose permease